MSNYTKKTPIIFFVPSSSPIYRPHFPLFVRSRKQNLGACEKSGSFTCKCFFRLDVEFLDADSIFTIGRHKLHWTVMLFPLSATKTKKCRNFHVMKAFFTAAAMVNGSLWEEKKRLEGAAVWSCYLHEIVLRFKSSSKSHPGNKCKCNNLHVSKSSRTTPFPHVTNKIVTFFVSWIRNAVPCIPLLPEHTNPDTNSLLGRLCNLQAAYKCEEICQILSCTVASFPERCCSKFARRHRSQRL